MIILGIDPGWDRCGWALLETQDRRGIANARPSLAGCGFIHTDRERSKAERLRELYQKISQLLGKAPKPDQVAIEEIHLPPKNIRISNLLNLGEARGVLLLAASQAGLPIQEIHPLAVKSTVTGSSKSTERDVARFLKFLIKDADFKGPDDTADAVAIALTSALLMKADRFLSPSPCPLPSRERERREIRLN